MYVDGIVVWTIISLVAALVGGIVIYVLVLKKENTFTGFLGWLIDFLNFKNLVIEDILKITYLIIAIFITLFSLGLIGVNIGSFLGLLVFGNILLRITYELSILIIKICNNTSEISKSLKKK